MRRFLFPLSAATFVAGLAACAPPQATGERADAFGRSLSIYYKQAAAFVGDESGEVIYYMIIDGDHVRCDGTVPDCSAEAERHIATREQHADDDDGGDDGGGDDGGDTGGGGETDGPA